MMPSTSYIWWSRLDSHSIMGGLRAREDVARTRNRRIRQARTRRRAIAIEKREAAATARRTARSAGARSTADTRIERAGPRQVGLCTFAIPALAIRTAAV